MLYCHLVPFEYFLGNNHSQISGFWGWFWWQCYFLSLDYWSWWSEVGTDLSWSTLRSLDQDQNYGDLSVTDTSFPRESDIYWYGSGISTTRILEGHKKNNTTKGRPKVKCLLITKLRTLGCISSQKDGTHQSQCIQWLRQAERYEQQTHSGRSEGTDCSNYHHSKKIMGKAKETREVQHTKKLLWPVCMIQIFITRCVTAWLSMILECPATDTHISVLLMSRTNCT